MTQCQTVLTSFFEVITKPQSVLSWKKWRQSMCQVVAPGVEMRRNLAGVFSSFWKYFVSHDGHHLPLSSVWGRQESQLSLRVRGGSVSSAEKWVIMGRPPPGWQESDPIAAQGQAKSKNTDPLDLQWETSPPWGQRDILYHHGEGSCAQESTDHWGPQ